MGTDAHKEDDTGLLGCGDLGFTNDLRRLASDGSISGWK